jgi:toxin YoeB
MPQAPCKPPIYKLVFTKQAQKDAKIIKEAGLKDKAQSFLYILILDPYHRPLPYEKLVEDLSGAYSRQINIQRRLV